MSPRNLQALAVRPVVTLPAPMSTTTGKKSSMQAASYMPFHKPCASPPTRGMASNTTSSRLHHRKPPRTRIFHPMRESSSPAKNGNNSRVKPIVSSGAVRAQPPTMV